MPSGASLFPSPPRRRRRRTETPQQPPEERDWAELPRDAVATVLGKLPVDGVLAGPAQVCRSWRHAAAEEPALWRRVEARFGAGLAAARLAVWRSAGRCEAFEAVRVADDRILLYLAAWLSCLKSLCLVSCYSVSSEGFIEAIQGFPLLEKLELSLCKNIYGEAIEAAGKACPHMKRFRLSNDRFYSFEDECINDQEAHGISTMRELRSLQLFANNLTNRGLAAILHSCPHLECLDIRHCFNVELDAALKVKCSRIKTLRLPNDITDDYEFEVKSPIRLNSKRSNFDDDDGDQNTYDPKSYYGDWNTYDPFKSYGEWNTYFLFRDHALAYDPSESDDDVLDDYEMYQIEDEDVDEPIDEPSMRMEEPGEIPEDEEAMMLDYDAILYEQELDEHKPDEDSKMI
ncbi:hypothetical protein SEVIR_6G030300v4 [Setaria viridis]|uniref:F-box domain-containing protein n=2 Tax=Setaria TaxID=4554 RepID=A0A368RHK9_SETIT|nr:putative F-box/LRR-repeat protein 23 [Setaria viridis]RCV29696.1 hypothetical protein SETIT_6G032800v2 [Setaria italica]TKW08476.1 hypothetical protein SEVIR_6G030300v2 [Setaria viridis]